MGTGRRVREGSEVAVITIGPIGNDVETVISGMDEAEASKVAHYDLRFLKPLDDKMLTEIGEKFDKIITVEDGIRMGGMGSAVLEWMSDHGYQPRIKRLGLPDNFVEHGTVDELRKVCGLDNDNMRKVIEETL